MNWMELIGLAIATIGAMDQWLLGKPVDRWIKLHVLTSPYCRLADFNSLIAYAKWIAKTYLRLTTLMGLPQHRWWILLAGLNLLITSQLQVLHTPVLIRLLDTVPHNRNASEEEFKLITRINEYAAKQGTDAKHLSEHYTLTDLEMLMPSDDGQIDPAEYLRWRASPTTTYKYGPSSFDRGLRWGQGIGILIGTAFAILGWAITIRIAKCILDTDRGVLIAMWWLLDLAIACSLTFCAVATTYLALSASGVAGTELFWVNLAVMFQVSGMVFLSTLTHSAIALFGFLLAAAELLRRTALHAMRNVDSSSNSVISSLLMLAGLITITVSMWLKMTSP